MTLVLFFKFSNFIICFCFDLKDPNLNNFNSEDQNQQEPYSEEQRIDDQNIEDFNQQEPNSEEPHQQDQTKHDLNQQNTHLQDPDLKN